MQWAHGRGMDLTLIEVMPLGDVGEGRLDQYLPLSMVRARLAERFTLDEIDYRTGGPARYVKWRRPAAGSASSRPSPIISANPAIVCASPAPVRCYMCLGQEDAADLRAPLRASEGNDLLDAAIDEAIAASPRATISSSTGATSARGGAPHERHRRLIRSPILARQRTNDRAYSTKVATAKNPGWPRVSQVSIDAAGSLRIKLAGSAKGGRSARRASG